MHSEPIWDEDFSHKKFVLGRIIHRESDLPTQLAALSLDFEIQPESKNSDKGMVVRTTNIDFFLNCDSLSVDQLYPHSQPQTETLEEEEPQWDEVPPVKMQSGLTPFQKMQQSQPTAFTPEQDDAIISY